MKAAHYHEYGDHEVVEINNDSPKPTVTEGQILVEVHAASLNPFDYKLRRGYMKEMIPLEFPVVLGGDFSGIVTEVSKTATEYSLGEEVYGQAIVINEGSGSIAEFAAMNTKSTARKPKNVSFTEAASLVLVGVSAIQALEEHIKLAKGQRILIHGGAGGIGSIAIQLAKHLGAYVTTTVSGSDTEMVKGLGADEVIDYKEQTFEELLSDYDAVFDTVGGETLDKSYAVLRKGGILVSIAGKPDEKRAEQQGIIAISQYSGTTTDRLNHLTELVESKVIKPQIDKIFPLEEARSAFEYLETSHPKGKVVIEIK